MVSLIFDHWLSRPRQYQPYILYVITRLSDKAFISNGSVLDVGITDSSVAILQKNYTMCQGVIWVHFGACTDSVYQLDLLLGLRVRLV